MLASNHKEKNNKGPDFVIPLDRLIRGVNGSGEKILAK